MWEKEYITTITGFSIKQTKDGGYIVACSDNSSEDTIKEPSELVLIKLQSNDEIEWETRWLDSEEEDYVEIESINARSVCETDEGYITCGYSLISSNASVKSNVSSFNKNGEFKWTKNYSFENKSRCFMPSYCIEQTADKGFIFVGYKKGTADTNEHYITAFKIDKAGKIEWKKTQLSQNTRK